MNEPPARALDPLRSQAEQLGLRIVEVDVRTFLVMRMGTTIYRANSLRDLELFLAMRA